MIISKRAYAISKSLFILESKKDPSMPRMHQKLCLVFWPLRSRAKHCGKKLIYLRQNHPFIKFCVTLSLNSQNLFFSSTQFQPAISSLFGTSERGISPNKLIWKKNETHIFFWHFRPSHFRSEFPKKILKIFLVPPYFSAINPYFKENL